MVLQEGGAEEASAPVQAPEQERGDEEALEPLPVRQAGAHVDHGQDVMGLAKELVAGAADGPRRAQDDEQGEQNHGHEAPYNVRLPHPFQADAGLRLVEPDLYDAPADGVEGALDKDDVAEPSVQKVKGLVRQPGQDGQQGLSAAQEHRQGRQGVGQDAHPVGPGAQARPGVEDAGLVLDGRDPGLVDDADEAQHQQVAGQNGQDGDLEARGAAKQEVVGVGEEMAAAEGGESRPDLVDPAPGPSGSRPQDRPAEVLEAGRQQENAADRGPKDADMEHADVVGVVDDVEIGAGAGIVLAGHDAVGVAPVRLQGVCVRVVLDVAAGEPAEGRRVHVVAMRVQGRWNNCVSWKRGNRQRDPSTTGED
ncbi:hypothetical protein G6O67_005204 [Ophiocordyceps sinensis]|uniref:Uncharacterized protein n=1 Tax=Ophiocordyceps sinensis TaxID=72228 RepID=A0A8H4PR19_9HYPO|nr:hypothetical protein G6O67_005204 [Ophiocordyceps sinensis]